MIESRKALEILAAADIIHATETVVSAIGRVAREITVHLRESNPLLLCVMNGGVPFAGHLMTHLTFPLDFDYVHVSRYGDATAGGELSWRVEPATSMRGRTVLLVDDILDEGVTLAAIRDRVLQRGADACFTAVLTEKLTGRRKRVRADFVALTVPDRFLFGFGMDVRGAWRNLPAIYAMQDE